MGTKSLTAITGTVYLFYMIIGGVLFMVLDEHHLLDITSRENSNSSAVFTDMGTVLLENFSKSQIEDAIVEWKREFTEFYFSNETVELIDIHWTYANSFFFAFHLCSTIGYGDIYPSTSYGRLFAVIYTLFGVLLHQLLVMMIGESFARSCQEIMMRVKGDPDNPLRRTLGYLGFFLPWIILFYVLPSIAFIFMENWNFIDGIYYCFLTLTTLGLGDYTAGSKPVSKTTYTLYKLLIFFWMLYGLAFTEMIVYFMTHLYQMHLLFSFECLECSCTECKCKFEHVYVDVEKMDIHFRLIRAEAVLPEYTMWSFPEYIRQGVVFRIKHMSELAALCEGIQAELICNHSFE